MRHNAVVTDFATADSWVILSPIEQSIKRKIEAVGVPLKDWDINIYRGVLTGYNEAFIISTEKRDEILNNCKTSEERQRTEELIRPILRGRDIRRYGYDWANLWLINTHNGIKGKLDRIHIEDYPAVKAHLDQYWDKISTRADKGDTPYNLRNCAYLDDFNSAKIIFQEIVQESQFCIDETEHFMCNDTCRIITGENLKSLLYVLNSKLFFFSVKTFYGGGNLGESGVRMKHTFFMHFPCIHIDGNAQYTDIDSVIYSMYGLNKEEINYIEHLNF